MPPATDKFLAVALSWSGKLYFQRRQDLQVLLSAPIVRGHILQFAQHLQKSFPGKFQVSIPVEPRTQTIRFEVFATPNVCWAQISYEGQPACYGLLFPGLDQHLDSLAMEATDKAIIEDCRHQNATPSHDLNSIKDRPLMASITYREFDEPINNTLWGTQNSLAAAYFNWLIWKRPLDISIT
jgi:hypothetical protein